MALPEAKTNIVYFCRVDAARTSDGSYLYDPLKMCTSSGAIFPLDTPWGEYVPVGGSLQVENISAGSEISDREFTMTLVGVSKDMIQFLRDHRTADNEVCVHRSDGVPDSETGYWRWSEPKIVALGHISQITINSQVITASCYTASTNLDTVVNYPTHWTQTHQHRFINTGDLAFQYANRYWTDTGIFTSWG